MASDQGTFHVNIDKNAKVRAEIVRAITALNAAGGGSARRPDAKAGPPEEAKAPRPDAKEGTPEATTPPPPASEVSR